MLTRIGFVGSRHPLMPVQRRVVRQTLEALHGQELLHGGWMGSEEEVMWIADEIGYRTIAHPSSDYPELLSAELDGNAEIRRPARSAVQTRRLVRSVRHLIVAPSACYVLPRARCGAAIRLARLRRKSLYVIYPDGRTVFERGWWEGLAPVRPIGVGSG